MSDNRPDAGDTMPDVGMETPDGGSVNPSDFRGQKLVIFFYPKDNTPGCTTENKDFSTLKAEFDKANTALLGVSKDSAKKHQNFIAKHDLKAPLATDAETDGLAEALGVWVEKKMYGKTYMGLERSTFLVDADGKIAQVWRKVKVKGHAEEVLAAAKEL
ncbi:peroxiredoxin [Aurantiacibacter sp. MUD61]|uniref:peroxiredoxin n=1 Tax=Aurantiacibacter sp. MUD61 TaxID=3009083 RepID=UPI0022F00493|nr:peroxiredoxin [Aurantiacibacter sp. MUD61]